MGEKLNHVEHKAEKLQHIEVRVENKETLASKERDAERAGEKQKQHAEAAREAVEKLARSAAETAPKKESRADDEKPTVVPNMSYRSVMHRVESQLPAYQRTFSRFIRNPNVDKASIIVGDTIARPSGIIGGAGLAFFGLLIFGLAAKNAGFALPNSLFVLLVIVGWTAGLLFDFVFTSVKRIVKTKS